MNIVVVEQIFQRFFDSDVSAAEPFISASPLGGKFCLGSFQEVP
jgi:hypothetical protein